MYDVENELKNARQKNLEITNELMESLYRREELNKKLTLTYFATLLLVLVLSGIILTK